MPSLSSVTSSITSAASTVSGVLGSAAAIGSAAGKIGAALAGGAPAAASSAPSSQKASDRPITFILDNLSTSEQNSVTLYIRPEDLTRNEPSRLTPHQSLGGDGGWVDSFGIGLGTVNISGTTGWRQDAHGDDGGARFTKLHDQIFKAWHDWRAFAAASGTDPNEVQLTFADTLDDFTWIVAPQSFVLRRNRARPLMFQYQMTLIRIADSAAVLTSDPATSKASVLGGISNALSTLSVLGTTLSALLPPSLAGVGAALTGLSGHLSQALSSVQGIVQRGAALMSVADHGMVNMATTLSSALGTSINVALQAGGLSQVAQATLQKVASVTSSAVAGVSNLISSASGSGTVPNYSSAFASTSGPMSTLSTFAAILPTPSAPIQITPSALSALQTIASADPVLGKLTTDQVASAGAVIASGLKLTGS